MRYINILWNTENKFNIYHEPGDIDNTLLNNICITRDYTVVQGMFQKEVPKMDRQYNIGQYRYIHKELADNYGGYYELSDY